MDKKKEYKPIIVLYLNTSDFSFIGTAQETDYLEGFSKKFKEQSKKMGYENSVMLSSPDIPTRIEIISVEKATIVEDIEKFFSK